MKYDNISQKLIHFLCKKLSLNRFLRLIVFFQLQICWRSLFFQWLEADGNGKAKDNQFPLRMKRVRNRGIERNPEIQTQKQRQTLRERKREEKSKEQRQIDKREGDREWKRRERKGDG